jgi:hypothetical protein
MYLLTVKIIYVEIYMNLVERKYLSRFELINTFVLVNSGLFSRERERERERETRRRIYYV